MKSRLDANKLDLAARFLHALVENGQVADQVLARQCLVHAERLSEIRKRLIKEDK